MSCAAGVRSRHVACSWNTGADCDPKAKPNSTTPCYIQGCPTNSDTFGNEWSGSGASSKEVFNEINTIPHDNHMPKSGIGSTRNQHHGNDDLNNIVEEDISHYSHVKKSSEKSIANKLHVDDFYYDYNFIRFHEDLSYDLEKEGNDAFDNSGVKHGDVYLRGTNVPITTTSSSSSTTADDHRTITEVPSGSITSRNTEGHGTQNLKDDLLDENNYDPFAEDYFLPVITTTEPSSAGTRLFNKWKESGFDLGITQDVSTTRNPPPTPETFHQPQDNNAFSHETPGPLEISDGNSNNSDGKRENQKDKTTTLVTDDNEEEIGEDVPGGESDWESFQNSQTFKPPFDVFQFETYENQHFDYPLTPSQWDTTASPTSTTSNPSELLSGASTYGFAEYESTTNDKASEQVFMTLDSLSQEFTASPISSNSAKLYSSMTSAAGTTALPPTDVESDLEPSRLTATEIPDVAFKTNTEQSRNFRATAPIRTTAPGAQDPRTQPWGTPVPLPRWTEIDDNEIKIAPFLTPVGLNSMLYTTIEPPSQGTSSDSSSSPLVPSSSSPANWRKGNWSAVSSQTCIPHIF